MRRRVSLKEASRGVAAAGQKPLPRAFHVDNDSDEDAVTDEEMRDILATRPKSRVECCPTPDTVVCPVCLAAVGVQCSHQDRKDLARAPLRPCPWVSCPHHKFLAVAPNGTIIFNYPDKKVWELEDTCELDSLESTPGELTLEELGDNFNLTRERMRQIEAKALAQLADSDEVRALAADLQNHPTGDGMEAIERRLDAEALARRTVFSKRPPSRVPVVGKCPTCGTVRFKRNGLWRCRCRRSHADEDGG